MSFGTKLSYAALQCNEHCAGAQIRPKISKMGFFVIRKKIIPPLGLSGDAFFEFINILALNTSQLSSQKRAMDPKSGQFSCFCQKNYFPSTPPDTSGFLGHFRFFFHFLCFAAAKSALLVFFSIFVFFSVLSSCSSS